MCTVPEKSQPLEYIQAKKTIPSLAFQISTITTIPTLYSSFPELSRQTYSGKELSSNETMDSTSCISCSRHGSAVQRRQTVLCLFDNPQCSHFRSGARRSPGLQNQLSTKSSSRSIHTCPSRSQCRTPGRPSPDKWRPLPQDRSGDRNAVGPLTPRVPEDVCQDVR